MFEDRGWLGGGEGFIEMVGKDGVMVGIKGGRGYKRRDWEDNQGKYGKLIKGVVGRDGKEIWGSEMRYVERNEGVWQVWVIREVYWDKMVGWGVGGRLESVYGLEGVKMGYKRIDEERGKGVIDE